MYFEECNAWRCNSPRCETGGLPWDRRARRGDCQDKHFAQLVHERKRLADIAVPSLARLMCQQERGNVGQDEPENIKQEQEQEGADDTEARLLDAMDSLLGVCRSLSGSNGSDIESIRKLAQLVQRLMIAYSITTVERLDPDPQDGVSWA